MKRLSAIFLLLCLPLIGLANNSYHQFIKLTIHNNSNQAIIIQGANGQFTKGFRPQLNDSIPAHGSRVVMTQASYGQANYGVLVLSTGTLSWEKSPSQQANINFYQDTETGRSMEIDTMTERSTGNEIIYQVNLNEAEPIMVSASQ